MQTSLSFQTPRVEKIVRSPNTKPPDAIAKVVPELKTSTIYADSCERMAALPDNSVDLIVTSPPYWVAPDDIGMVPAQLKDSAGGTPQSYEELLTLLSRCFAECFRVLKPGRVCAVNVATTLVDGTFYPLPFHLVPLMELLGWRMKEDLIWRRWRGWDKRGGVVIQKPYPGYFYPNRIFEYVLLFTKPGGPPTYANRTEAEREESRIPVDDLLLHELNNNIWNILPVQPQRRAMGKDGTQHPCPYPEELAYRLITLYSYKGDVVLDPFTGSGTTLKVANLTGRRWVGYEPNPNFRRLAKERIRTEAAIQRQRRITRFETLPNVPEEVVSERHPALAVKQTR